MALIKKILFRAYVKYVLRSFINVRLGRIFYSNDGGLYSNVIGGYVLSRDSKKSFKNGFLSKPNKSSKILEKDGFLVDHHLEGDTQIEEISKKCIRSSACNAFNNFGYLLLTFLYRLTNGNFALFFSSQYGSILHPNLNNNFLDHLGKAAIF